MPRRNDIMISNIKKSIKTVISRMPIARSYLDSYSLGKRYTDIINYDYPLRLEYAMKSFHIAEIEINKNCNLNCIMCNSAMSRRPNITMDVNIFEKAVSYEEQYGRGVTSLHTIGEPLINPNLENYLKILRKHNVKVFLSTNGLLLKDKYDLLLEYRDIISSLRFSIDGATKITYEKIRKPGIFEKLIDNLEFFREATRESKPFKDVWIASIVSEDNKNEIAYHLNFYSKYVPMNRIDLNLVSGLSPDNSYFLERSILKKHIVPWPPCDQLFCSTIHILNNGNTTACCRDYDGDLVFGNISDGDPHELINNDKLVELRKMHISKKIPENILCSSCYRIDPKVSSLFKLFFITLIELHSDHWNMEDMQERFDLFFHLFAKSIPSKGQFIQLLK